LLNLPARFAGKRKSATPLASMTTVDHDPVHRSTFVRVLGPGDGVSMFVETVTAPRELWQQWTSRLRLVSEPPSALAALVAWDVGDDTITSVHVWDNPSAVADFFVERVQPLIEAEGPPDYKPVRHGNAVAAYFRAQAPQR
jgi:hypothetical protein